jgi:hypothetical protein
LGLVLALGIALGAPSAAWAQQQWTTVGSAGTVDESSQVIVTGPNASLAGGTVAVIRYNVVAVDGLFGSECGVNFMLVRYRATPQHRVLVRLVELNLFTGPPGTTRLVLDSNDFPSNDQFGSDFQTQTVAGGFSFDFVTNAYFIVVELSSGGVLAGSAQIQAIQVGAVLIC